jgi:hypothetical protein
VDTRRSVPIFQLVEQRIITPCLGVIQNKGCNPKVLGGALIVLLVSLPGAIMKAASALCGGGGGGGGGGAAGSITLILQKLAVLIGRSTAGGQMNKKQVTRSPTRSKTAPSAPSAKDNGESTTKTLAGKHVVLSPAQSATKKGTATV